MPSTNADVVRNAILAQNRGDDEAMLDALDPAVVFNTDSGTTHGREALRQVLVDARAEVGEVRVTMHELREEADAVLVVGSVATGNGMHMPRAWIWRMRNGRGVRVDSYPGADEALRAWQSLVGAGESGPS